MPERQNNLEQKEQCRKTYHFRTVLSKTDIQSNGKNRRHKLSSHNCSYEIVDKHVKKHILEKDNIVNGCCWENWISKCSRMKLDPYLSLCKTKFFWMDQETHCDAEMLKLI